MNGALNNVCYTIVWKYQGFLGWRPGQENSGSYLIFVTGTTGRACGEFFCHVEKFLHMTDFHVEKFSTWHDVMWKMLSTWEMWKKSVMWRNFLHNWWFFVALNCCKIIVLVIYAILSRIFCRDLRTSVWRKIEPKNCVCGEKRTNIMYALGSLKLCKNWWKYARIPTV